MGAHRNDSASTDSSRKEDGMAPPSKREISSKKVGVIPNFMGPD
jgi:hypothetical protein